MRFGESGMKSIGAACMLSVVMHGCARERDANEARPAPASTSAVVARVQNTPDSLSDAGRLAENIYDYARASDWKNAAFEVSELGDAIKNVRAQVESESDLKDDLYGHALALDRATEQSIGGNARSEPSHSRRWRDHHRVQIDQADRIEQARLLRS